MLYFEYENENSFGDVVFHVNAHVAEDGENKRSSCSIQLTLDNPITSVSYSEYLTTLLKQVSISLFSKDLTNRAVIDMLLEVVREMSGLDYYALLVQLVDTSSAIDPCFCSYSRIFYND